MKRVLIYGDSNVWGKNCSGPRIPYYQRWTSRLKRLFKGKFEIIANGVSGRVAGDYREKTQCNGQSAFRKVYEKAGRVDLVVVALGTNDLRESFDRSVNEIIADLLWYKDAANKSEIMYVLPSIFSSGEDSGPEFTVKSLRLRDQLIQNKNKLGNYLVINDIDLSDGIHFSPEGHRQMAKIVGEKLREFI